MSRSTLARPCRRRRNLHRQPSAIQVIEKMKPPTTPAPRATLVGVGIPRSDAFAVTVVVAPNAGQGPVQGRGFHRRQRHRSSHPCPRQRLSGVVELIRDGATIRLTKRAGRPSATGECQDTAPPEPKPASSGKSASTLQASSRVSSTLRVMARYFDAST